MLINNAAYVEGGVSFTSLDAVTLKFSGSNNPLAEKVIIEIAPAEYGAFEIEVAVVNGDNVNSSNLSSYLNTAANLSTSVVLIGDINISAGDKLKLGGNTLYGNGYIITAEQYKSAGTGSDYLNDYFISINGGTIDNIYLAGPTYPVLDYDNAANGYHISGIMASGESTIQNSYVSGFRQPVMAAGTTTHVNNTTLRGGNYANLVHKTGILNLTDVTTIQDPDGIKPTVDVTDANKNIGIMGLGIAIEGTAIQNVSGGLNLYGYLDQYNWVKYRQAGDPQVNLPIVPIAGKDPINVSNVINCIFNGVEMKAPIQLKWLIGKPTNMTVNVHAEMGSLKEFIHKDSTATSGYGQYMNSGIIFAELGEAAENYVINEDFVKDYRTGENNVSKRTMKKLDIPFGKTGMSVNKGLGIVTVIANVYASDYLGTKGRFAAWSCVDGRVWVVDDIGIDDETYAITRTVSCSNESTNYIVTDSAIDGITTKTPLNYKGSYSTGAYADAYN